MPRRATFATSRGTVFAMAGVAIGLGNIWRFPYMMGKYGGMVFLIVYLAIIVVFGVPALMAELALGRHTRRGTWQAFQRAGLPGGRWWSYLLLLTIIMASSYYGVVLAWVLFFAVAFGANATAGTALPTFASLVNDLPLQLAFVAVTVAVACTGLYFGVKRGIERFSRVALPLFFVLFAVLIVRAVTLPDAAAGFWEFLTPRWSDFTRTTPLAALGQAFFSLGLGGTFMVVYGSYMKSEADIPRSALLTALADVGAALMAAAVIVPSAFAFGVPLNSGPPLMFQVMPDVFGQMPAGSGFAALFFGSIFLVAMLSLMAGYEVLVAALEDGPGWSRRRALVVIGGIQFALAIPALLITSYIEYSDLIWGSTMQPVGGVLAVVALTWCIGRSRTLAEIRAHSDLPVPGWLYLWIKYVIPAGILGMLGYGWLGR